MEHRISHSQADISTQSTEQSGIEEDILLARCRLEAAYEMSVQDFRASPAISRIYDKAAADFACLAVCEYRALKEASDGV